MSSGNHLTIRDYLDQLLVEKPAKRKAISSVNADTSRARMFHRILTSHLSQRLGNTDVKSTGLTIIDYLANSIRAKHQYRLPLLPTPYETKERNADKSPEHSALFSTKTATENTASPARAKRKQVALPLPSASISSQKQTGSHERQRIEKSIHKAARKYRLSPELIRGVIRAESNFEIKAVSHAGAQGLMQLMPSTAKELGVRNPFDINQNIDGGSRYLRKMLDNFGGNVKLALAAYNAGPGTVIKYGGNVPYKETKQYIDRVLQFSKKMA